MEGGKGRTPFTIQMRCPAVAPKGVAIAYAHTAGAILLRKSSQRFSSAWTKVNQRDRHVREERILKQSKGAKRNHNPGARRDGRLLIRIVLSAIGDGEPSAFLVSVRSRHLMFEMLDVRFRHVVPSRRERRRREKRRPSGAPAYDIGLSGDDEWGTRVPRVSCSVVRTPTQLLARASCRLSAREGDGPVGGAEFAKPSAERSRQHEARG